MSQDKKSEIRKRFLRLRKSLSRETVDVRSFDVILNIKSVIPDNVKSVMLYVPINNEVDILPLAVELFKSGKTIMFPRLVDNKVVPYVVDDIDFDFKMGAFNIPEPDTRPFKGRIDLILVPGIAFDRSGGRLGYGYGYFDRFLADTDFGDIIGVAFSFQLVDKLPVTDMDFRVRRIATEDGVVTIS
jgi:5-formyltetrahydrofolate cyclo-ligase